MAVKTAANPKRKSYANRVRALIISMFGLSKQDWAEQNKAWKNWFEIKQQDRDDHHELEALLKRDVKDAFKARVAERARALGASEEAITQSLGR